MLTMTIELAIVGPNGLGTTSKYWDSIILVPTLSELNEWNNKHTLNKWTLIEEILPKNHFFFFHFTFISFRKPGRDNICQNEARGGIEGRKKKFNKRRDFGLSARFQPRILFPLFTETLIRHPLFITDSQIWEKDLSRCLSASYLFIF